MDVIVKFIVMDAVENLPTGIICASYKDALEWIATTGVPGCQYMIEKRFFVQ